MKQKHVFILSLSLLISVGISAQVKTAYSGTIFVDGTIITSADPSAFKSITANGQGIRRVFDRRTDRSSNINAYLFNVVWSDGLSSEIQVNPEFGDSAAQAEANKYAVIIGRIPTCLRRDIKAITIHKGRNPFGGGDHGILIHTGMSAVYERTGILEETLVHEASHTSLDDLYARAPGWLAAQTADVNFISSYAKTNPFREDVAESFLMWIACRQSPLRISQKNYDLINSHIPNRLVFFDKQKLAMFPLSLPSLETNKATANK